ncbi:hypothetical protein C0Q70_18246 [Pomacea canaliculata]|uniref:Protein quiver n=1 Tax=Pomacea canaliculata TaxID=400727 RepID=A0A2T7NMQ0_POMCA|nr:hypothetical protein C0Q70_18246 [Pomacea canaliculata]
MYMVDRKVDSLLLASCRSYPIYRKCMESAMSSCPPRRRLGYDVILASLDFICSPEGGRALATVAPCLQDDLLVRDLGSCHMNINTAFSNVCSAPELPPVASGTYCTTPSPPTTLSLTALPRSPPPAPPPPLTPPPPHPLPLFSSQRQHHRQPRLLQERRLRHQQQLLQLQLQKRQQPDLQPSPPQQCFDCNSGNPQGWTNPHCTANGYVNPTTTFSVTCATRSCFSRMSLTPKGAVYRGCLDGWRHMFPSGQYPTSGCRNMGGETWCFCGDNRCNTHDMTGFL